MSNKVADSHKRAVTGDFHGEEADKRQEQKQ